VIVAVAAGKYVLDPTLTTRVSHLMRDSGIPASRQDWLAILSISEKRQLALLVPRMTNTEIAELWDLRDNTVKTTSAGSSRN
jgi:DNA-binding NarL/FixJ family response regulator